MPKLSEDDLSFLTPEEKQTFATLGDAEKFSRFSGKRLRDLLRTMMRTVNSNASALDIHDQAVADLPAASQAHQGKIVVIPGTGAARDQWWACVYCNDGVYRWVHFGPKLARAHAHVTKAVDLAGTGVAQVVAFDTAVYDPDGWLQAGGGLLVPAGVSEVRIVASLWYLAAGAGQLWVHKNGAAFPGTPFLGLGAGASGLNISTGPIQCVAGDVFTIVAIIPAGSVMKFNAGTKDFSWCKIEGVRP